MSTLRSILELIVRLYLVVLFGRLILDLVRSFARDWRPQGVMLIIAEGVYTLTDPPLKALRRVLPPLQMRQVSLDLGFLVLVLGLNLLLVIL